MADTIIFRGVYIRSFELRNGEDGRHVRIHCTADWTDPVRSHMGWDEVGDGIGAADLVGKLAASNVILTPAPKPLRDREIEIAADDVSGFNLVPVKDSSGEVNGRELRFTVKTTSTEAAALLETYCHSIGRGLAQLKVSYVKQEELPLADEEKKPAHAPVN